MDQMGEVNYVPGEPKGTPWHRHRGFETVTYMIDGVFRHQDSNGGGGGLITDGDTQWMTAVPRPWRSYQQSTGRAPCYRASSQVAPIRKCHKDEVNRRSSWRAAASSRGDTRQG
jgi:Pirin